MDFKLESDFSPTGDQPNAIKELVEGINSGTFAQTLLGVAEVVRLFYCRQCDQSSKKPTLDFEPQHDIGRSALAGEFKQFFPENRVEYFVSYYDYYQPEAFFAHNRNIY